MGILGELMTLIWPTENDLHLDDESGTDMELVANNLGYEPLWTKMWQSIAPASLGSWIPVPFNNIGVIPPTENALTLVVARGTAVINGYWISFQNETDDISIVLPSTAAHYYVMLELTTSNGRINGYQWHTDSTPTVRPNSISIGQAIVNNGLIQKWFPWTWSEGWRVCTGKYNSNQSPKQKDFVLGFAPVRVKLGGTNPPPTATLEAWGFSVDLTGFSDTFQALVFDRT